VGKKKPSPRNERRAAARDAERLARDRARLARLEPGGTPERPIEVESASQIETVALGMACLSCEGPNRLMEHAAELVEEIRLRRVELACARCGARRTVWFRIVVSLPS
jgi:hypothetical protein